MLQFLTPLWLLALPTVILPWLWPLLKPRTRQPQPFSAFFLLPPETLRQQLRFSREDFWIKLLRSLLVLLAVLLLARPYWLEEPPPLELWVVDDSASLTTQPSLQSNLPTGIQPLLLSELFPPPAEAPVQTKFQGSFFAGTPNLGEIGQAIMQSRPETERNRRLIVHLASDFQRSQYWPYAPVALPIEWRFERPQGLQSTPNLGLRQLRVKTEGKLSAVLEVELFGEQPKSTEVRITVEQESQKLHESVISWKGTPERHRLVLSPEYEHHAPLQILIEPQLPDPDYDNHYYFQSSRGDDLRVGLLSTEGVSALYRYGLHPLKSALNANDFFSFLFSNPETLKAANPDLVILLADDPRRFVDVYPETPIRLFVPTRPADWNSLAADNHSLLPKEQLALDWSKADLGPEWLIEQSIPGLHQATAQQLWLLDTGVSNAWGPLYQQQSFVDQLRDWLSYLWQEHPRRQLGSLKVGQQISGVTPGWRLPGHYELKDDNLTLAFAVNLAEQESLPELMTEEELEQMQSFFVDQAAFLERQQAASDTLQDWLRWLLLLLLLLEVLWVLKRLLKPEASPT